MAFTSGLCIQTNAFRGGDAIVPDGSDNEMTSDVPAQAYQLVRPVVLIGLMGAGKTSVGSRLAQALGVPFVDSDDEIQTAANLSIAEIFAKYGEAHFRSGERRVISRLVGAKPQVISTGGGAYMDDETRAVLAKRAITVWLKADLDVLVSRTAGRTHRPLLNKGNPRDVLSDLIEKRYPVYAQADLAVHSLAGQTHDSMVRRIIKALVADGRALLPEGA